MDALATTSGKERPRVLGGARAARGGPTWLSARRWASLASASCSCLSSRALASWASRSRAWLPCTSCWRASSRAEGTRSRGWPRCCRPATLGLSRRGDPTSRKLTVLQKEVGATFLHQSTSFAKERPSKAVHLSCPHASRYGQTAFLVPPTAPLPHTITGHS